jgi:hypothetical protein
MFSGNTKAQRTEQQRWFALELSKRCAAEFSACHDKFKDDFEKMREALAPVPSAIIKCYQGNCSLCRQHSFVCPDSWDSSYLPGHFEIYPSSSDETQLLKCIKMRLGEEALRKTYLKTSTQKCEAFNRTLSRTNPKILTFKRNFAGRIHSAAHLVNCGIASSTIQKCARVGAPLQTGTRVVTQLQKEEKRIQYIREKMKSTAYRHRRQENRKKRYQSYFVKKEKIQYRKGLCDECPAMQDHEYAAISKVKGGCSSTSNIILRPRQGRKQAHYI